MGRSVIKKEDSLKMNWALPNQERSYRKVKNSLTTTITKFPWDSDDQSLNGSDEKNDNDFYILRV